MPQIRHIRILPVILKRQMMRKSKSLIARSATYALFSNLVNSPHEDHVLFEDIGMAISAIQKELPFKINFDALIKETKTVTEKEWKKIARSYSGLFEVGNDGPPIPIRESANPVLSFNKEEVTRFYEYFGYEVSDERQWESVHLAIELEFIHFLCQGELVSEDVLSFQLAQKDFIDRHFILWLASINHKIKDLDAHPYWIEIFSALYTFVQQDLKWLNNATKTPKPTPKKTPKKTRDAGTQNHEEEIDVKMVI